ncbi:MAG: 7TM diverse intracellular signaling domain-containing protein, partial [Deltaproteobacteria bacterium]
MVETRLEVNLRSPSRDRPRCLKDLFFTLFLALTILLVFSPMACQRDLPEKTPPRAVKGVLDLRDWDLKKDGPVDLSGEYAFYWMQHLAPQDFSQAGPPEKTGFIQVPGYWCSFRLKGKKLPGEGYATYRLRILVASPMESLALRFTAMGTAFAAYVNGKKVASAGVPGTERSATKPQFFPQVADFALREKEMDLLLQVSNFHHRRAGAWEAIKLGTETDIRNLRERRVALDLFLFGSIFIIGMYHAGLFILRRKDRSPLYFSIFCFLIAVRILTIEERYLIHLFPRMSWEFMVKLEYMSFYLAIPVFALFMRSLFQDLSKRFLIFIAIAASVLSAIVLITPVRTFSHTLPIAQALILLTAVYGFYVLILSWIHKSEGAVIFLVGFIILSLTAVNDVLHVEKIVQTGFYAPLGLLAFIFSQAFLLSLRFSRAHSTVETQQEELRDTVQAYKKEVGDRVLAEQALCESEEKYRTILHSIEDGYYEVDLEGKMTFFNDSLCRIVGYSRDELLGMGYQHLMTEEMAKNVFETFNEVYRTGKAAKAFGWELIRKDRARRYAENSVSLIRDSEGQSVGFRGIARDITERKEAEEQAKHHQQQLMQASKMVALGTLVSGVAHEINNPNNFIMLNTPILSEAWQNALPILEEYYRENGDFVLGGMKYSEIRENIPSLFSGIIDGSKQIKQIVDDLKNYVREERADLTQPVDVNAVLESSVSLVSNMIKKSTSHFSTDLAENLPTLRGNFQRLEQVMINLIQNACQAIPDNRRGIRVSTRWEREKGCILVTVEDEGTGIPLEILPHIRDPFFTTRHDKGGVGLGLSISARIVEEHGGTMDFTSEPGK